MEMIGRKAEAEALTDALESDESQFVAVYGRRRVGKTFLVRETLGTHIIFENVGVYDGTLTEELGAFRKALVKWGATDAGVSHLKSENTQLNPTEATRLGSTATSTPASSNQK